jgi:TRAP-type C4-dicarboxylate transport system permease small subunit
MADLGTPPPGREREGRSRPVPRSIAGVSAVLETSGKIIAAVCLIMMFAALLANVVLRYALGSGIPWAYEIHAILFPWAVAGGVVVATAQGRNIAVTILPDLIGPDARRFLLLAIDVLVVVIALSVLWSSQPIVMASRFQRLSALGVTQIWGYLSLVYAFGLIAVLAALDALSLALSGTSIADDDPALKSLS